jgi:hypothetical protein
VHSTSWHFNGGDILMYGAYGKLLTGLRPDWPRDRWGELPDALDDDLRAVGGFAASDPDLGPHPTSHPGAVALAAIELRTAARATAEWLTGPHTMIRLPRPLPDDPRPATVFARVDPDLDAWLRLARDEVRRAAVRHALRRVVERFDAAADPVVALLLPAVEAGEPVAEGPALTVVQQASRNAPGRKAVPPDDPEALRLRARSALIGALAQPTYVRRPLDELWNAKEVLGDEWPELRAELLAIARSALTSSLRG